jgi:hypothetical protein
MRDMVPNLRTASTAAPADLRKAWETAARVRFVRSRRALGLSQGGAAALIHASVDAVERWESGRCRVPAWALVALEDRLRERSLFLPASEAVSRCADDRCNEAARQPAAKEAA